LNSALSPFCTASKSNERKLSNGKDGKTRMLDLEDSMLWVNREGFALVRAEVKVERAVLAQGILPRMR
jgi:hypothetical protein